MEQRHAWDTEGMTMMGPVPRTAQNVGETIATYDEYEAAQKAVTKLIEAEVPARQISIVWANLRAVEMVTGRLGYGRAAWSGALNGAMLGLLFGAIYTLLSPQASLQLLVGCMLVGTALGMVMQLLSYRMVRRRREYSSTTQPVADHYEVAVAAEHASAARRILGQQPRTREVVRPSGPLPPPQFGIRIDPETNRPVDETPPQAPETPPVPPVPETPAAEAAGAPPQSAEPSSDDESATEPTSGAESTPEASEQDESSDPPDARGSA